MSGQRSSGPPAGYRDLVLGAPACACTETARAEAEHAALREEWLRAAYGLWESAGVPKRYADYSFEGFRPVKGAEKALQVCREYATTFTRGRSLGLLLFGPPGNGKTRLGLSAARVIVGRTLTPLRFEAIADLLQSVRPTAARPAWDHSRVEGARRVPLLVLDDVGQEDGPAVRDLVYGIIDARFRAELPTIITTNAGAGELAERLGAAAVSRLAESAKAVAVTAPDFRVQLAKERVA
jgi:DNA replication protein DnaC